MSERDLGAGHPHLGVTLNSMGNLERRLGCWQEAEQAFEDILAYIDPDRYDSRAGNALRGLAKLALVRGRPEQAAELARRAVTALEADLPPSHRELVDARSLLDPASL